MDQQQFPMQFHGVQHALPVDSLMLLEDHVRDICAIIAIAILDEELGQDEFGGRRDADAGPVDFGVEFVAEPLLRHWQAGRRDIVDDVEEITVLPDLPDPALILEFHFMAQMAEMGQDPRRIAPLAEDIKIFCGTRDPGMTAQCIGAREHEGDTRNHQLCEAIGIELPRLWRRVEGSRITGHDGIIVSIGKGNRRTLHPFRRGAMDKPGTEPH